ncbi:MAG: hypothetical protein HQL21_02665 [Candidatus Omnitrophica bacterium]|nr:hypothetical protein [Candidatus Omnitrophota bacterium]
MWVVFLLIGVLVFALCLFGWLFFKIKAKRAAALNAGGVPSINAGLGKFKPPEFPGKKSFGPSFRPLNSLKKDILQPQGVGLDKGGSLAQPTMSASFSPQASAPAPAASAIVPVPSPLALKDSLIDEKLIVRDNEIQQLQEELKNVREKGEDRVRQALETLNKLHEENDRLLGDMERFRSEWAKASGDTEALNQLRQENVEFKAQLEVASQSQKEVQEQIESLRQVSSSQLAKANEMIARLEKETQGLRSSSDDFSAREAAVGGIREEYQKQISDLRGEIDLLQRDNEALKKAQAGVHLQNENVSGKEDVHGLEQVNGALEEKNKFLQYELTKSRAQASGFERICEGSKKRLEDMANDIRSLEQEKEVLKRKAGDLEKNLESLRKTNPSTGNPHANF